MARFVAVAYMEIGTANVSVIIGAYSHPVAMTTDKFSVPYLVTSTTDVARAARQLNVVDVLPTSVDLLAATVDFISSAHWTSVAVLSQPDLGAVYCLYTNRLVVVSK